MAAYDIQARRARYFKLSSEIAHLDNVQLRSLFDATETQRGWGSNHVIDIGRSKVFVKRLPVTDREFENLFSTSNMYMLPTYYHYGVGSAGFGSFRELVAHIKTTNWVLEGAITNFPLLYHYRILPVSGARATVDMERYQGYIEYWNSNENIGRYMHDRAHANNQLALFLEHLPYPVEAWLLQNPDQINRVLEDLRNAISFLRKHGILHLDANFDNVLSDGEHAYLTDFGLVIDQRFALTQDEALFLKQHMYYDYGEVLGSLGFLLYGLYYVLSDNDKQKVRTTLGVADGTPPHELAPILLDNIKKIHADGMLNLDPSFVGIIEKYHSIIKLYVEFVAEMRSNKRKNTPFPHRKLIGLLKETRFLSEHI